MFDVLRVSPLGIGHDMTLIGRAFRWENAITLANEAQTTSTAPEVWYVIHDIRPGGWHEVYRTDPRPQPRQHGRTLHMPRRHR